MRPFRAERMLRVAQEIATGSTCVRRAVGCVLTDRRGKILATGHNGVASGLPHCNEGHPCLGSDAASGTRLSECQAVHAEANALLQCADVQAIHTCYVTVSPCVDCTKLLMNTSCEKIVFLEPYAHETEAKNLWTVVRRRTWLHV